MKPLCIDLYSGLGGWAEGFLAEGYRCIGFDIERHRYPRARRPGSLLQEWDEYPGELVLQGVLTIHGSQFRNAACIVASPPCQQFSYMAMPWKRAKQIAAALRGEYDAGGKVEFPAGYTGSRTLAQLTALFDACFRIQREASEAAGRHIPMVVENVKGAQPWVGRAKANYGSFYLWGDVESVGGRIVAAHQVRFGAPGVKAYRAQKFNPDGTEHGTGSWFAVADSKNRGARKPDTLNEPFSGHDDPRRGRINENGSWFGIGSNGKPNKRVDDGRKVPMNFHEHEKTGKPGRSFQSAAVDGLKLKDSDGYERSHPEAFGWKSQRTSSSATSARKAASAAIAKIPFDLAAHIARCFKPGAEAAA